MYKVVKLNTKLGVQWLVVDKRGNLVEMPCKFLKHIRLIGQTRRTQRSYAYSLKYFWQYLEAINLSYQDVSMKTFFGFLGWLQNPLLITNVIEISPSAPIRSAKTVNTYMAGVMSFYQYLYDINVISTNFHSASLRSLAYIGTNPKYKDFLYHTHKGQATMVSKLKVREKRSPIKVLNSEQVHQVINATTNIRDKFLVYLLFVSGLRIGELLSLYNADIIYDLRNGHRIQLTDRGELPNGGELKTGERIVYINQTCMNLYDDYQYEMIDRINKDSNFVFVKIKGAQAGEPMNYDDIMSLFRRLKKKTGLELYPHLLRHTHATMYYAKTKDAKALQERLGHKDIQTTLNAYVHPTTDDILADWENAKTEFRIGELI